MRIYKIAAIPGDGIGKEVISAGLDVLSAIAVQSKYFKFDVENFDWGTDRYKSLGRLMPEDGVDH